MIRPAEGLGKFFCGTVSNSEEQTAAPGKLKGIGEDRGRKKPSLGLILRAKFKDFPREDEIPSKDEIKPIDLEITRSSEEFRNQTENKEQFCGFIG